MKHGVWILWIGSLAAMTLGNGSVATIGQIAFWVTVAAHLAEFVVKRPLFARAGGSMTRHFVQTMIYGLFHWKPIEDRLGASS